MRRWQSAELKMLMLGVAAVLLPTAVLSVLQYRSLVALQSQTKVVAQENLRQTLQQVTQQAKARLAARMSESFAAFVPQDFAPSQRAQTEQRLQLLRQTHPEIEQLFVLAHCACQPTKFALFSQTNGWRWAEAAEFPQDQAIKQALDLHDKAQLLHDPTDALHGTHFWQDTCSIFSDTQSRHSDSPLQSFVFHPLRHPATHEAAGFFGVVLRRDWLKAEFLPPLLKELARGTESLVILDEHKRPWLGNAARLSHYETRLSFAPVFPKWELAGGYADTTIEALARANFQRGLWLTACVLLLLLGGIVFAFRVAAREVHLAEAKATFVSNVSHELKTPLALIRMFAETLELGRVKNADKAQEYYRIIHHESRRLTQLINNILDFSRIEAGRKEYHFVAADVAAVVADVLKSYEYQLQSLGFVVEADLPRNLPPALLDRDALAQAVLNLLNNAVKYSPAEKRLLVRVRAQDPHLVIEVTDHGIGIARTEHDRIFEKFYRVSTGLVHDTNGSGLGLALVKHIIAAHHGHVEVQSAPGQGSCFRLFLPQLASAPDSFAAGGLRLAENSHH